MVSHLLFLDFSGGEFLLIGVVFLMFFGSKSIPGIARSLGKAMRQFREAAGDVQREIHESANTNLKDFDLNITSENKAPTLPPVVPPPSAPQQTEEKSKSEDKTSS